MAFPLSICQSILYKCLLIFKWQKCAAMDDDFWGTYMGMANIMFGMMIGTVRLILGNLYHKGFVILSGIQVEDQLKDNKARWIRLSKFHWKRFSFLTNILFNVHLQLLLPDFCNFCSNPLCWRQDCYIDRKKKCKTTDLCIDKSNSDDGTPFGEQSSTRTK